MSPRSIGLFIGAAFGMLFVVLNAGAPVPPAVGWVLRGLAVLGLLVLVYLLFGLQRRGRDVPSTPGVAMFGNGYRWVVLGEVVGLVAGFLVLRLIDAPGESGVAWTAFVVGVHFLALAVVWRERSVRVPGVALTLLGVLGLALCATPAVAWVPLLSGVLSGVVLLGGSLAVAAWARG